MSISKSAAPPADRCRVTVIHNPAAGLRQRRRLHRFLRELERRGHTVRLFRTAHPGDGMAIAAALDAASVDVVVAAGGDGTVNEVANGLAGRSIPLAIMPLGTANVLAWELGLGTKIPAAADLLSAGRIVEVRMAHAGPWRFLLMASAGPDARVVAAVHSRLKRWLGKGAYVFGPTE